MFMKLIKMKNGNFHLTVKKKKSMASNEFQPSLLLFGFVANACGAVLSWQFWP